MEEKRAKLQSKLFGEKIDFTSSDIDLHRDATVKIDDIPVISADALGVTVQKVVLQVLED